jgi:hypothetical protein
MKISASNLDAFASTALISVCLSVFIIFSTISYTHLFIILFMDTSRKLDHFQDLRLFNS